jgi:hypothetical protein
VLLQMVLPRPTPGHPQWISPKLAVQGYRVSDLAPNLSLATYTAALRAVSAEMDVESVECTPPVTAGAPRPRTAADGRRARARHGISIGLHLRRGDAWRATKVSTKSVKAINEQTRATFDNMTQLAVLTVVRLLDAAAAATDHASGRSMEHASESATLPHPVRTHNVTSARTSRLLAGELQRPKHSLRPVRAVPARWLIVSDNATAAAEYAARIEAASTSGQTAWVVPDGFTLWSLLALRHMSGIVQSSLRAWSSFSALPAIMADVPIFGMAHGKFGVLPHVQCETAEEFVLGQEAAFVQRLLRGVRNCSERSERGHVE